MTTTQIENTATCPDSRDEGNKAEGSIATGTTPKDDQGY
jgi:hypothetical protein